MIILGVGGYARSGKDTTAGFLIQDHGFQRFAFADALRRISEILDPGLDVRDLIINDPVLVPLSRILKQENGWDGAKSRYPSVRSWLQRLGTEAGRDVLGDTIWVDTVFRQMKDAEEARLLVWPGFGGVDVPPPPAGRYVITDVRFPNELAAVRQHGGLTAWVRRPGVAPVNTHVSDNALGPDDFDVVIENDGDLVHLRNTVTRLVEALGLTTTS